MFRSAMLLLISISMGCGEVMSFNQSSFFSAFSLRSLVGRASSRSGLDCSAGGTGGGGGGGTGGREVRRDVRESIEWSSKKSGGG